MQDRLLLLIILNFSHKFFTVYTTKKHFLKKKCFFVFDMGRHYDTGFRVIN